jgi:hypothetical protein
MILDLLTVNGTDAGSGGGTDQIYRIVSGERGQGQFYQSRMLPQFVEGPPEEWHIRCVFLSNRGDEEHGPTIESSAQKCK